MTKTGPTTMLGTGWYLLAALTFVAIGLWWAFRNEWRIIRARDAFTYERASSVIPLTNTAPPATGTRRVLVLDLDETLVHARVTGDAPESQTAKKNQSKSLQVSGLQVQLRPGVHEFLHRMRAVYDEIVLFTASLPVYADPVLEALDPGGTLFGRRFYRKACHPTTLVKDLRLLGEPLDTVIIVDNTPSAFALQPRNGVAVSSFVGDPEDDGLQAITPTLLQVARARDRDARDVLDAARVPPLFAFA